MGNKKILKDLKKFKEKLLRNISVDKIILFGSQVTGKTHKDSDVDLIVVSKDFEGKKSRYRAIGFYTNWNLDYPVDFLCFTPKEFNKLKNQITIVKEAVENGIEIK